MHVGAGDGPGVMLARYGVSMRDVGPSGCSALRRCDDPLSRRSPLTPGVEVVPHVSAILYRLRDYGCDSYHSYQLTARAELHSYRPGRDVKAQG